ncbi:MAG TPA: UDP-3-O-(3-hydroxymyristoyl)glucosamine N-acyltransferase [Nevskia sp.]|nr:UDP-3-O-(3-hydroxymyristoyl)glucosamine N-acyltransferase [Nevskia sp.]
MAASPDTYTLEELAQRFGLKLQGDGQLRIGGVCALAPGRPGHLSFCADPRLRGALAGTQASAVVLPAREAEAYKGNALVAANAELAFYQIAKLFDRSQDFAPGIHPAAAVDPGATIGAGCWIGPHAVIEAGAVIGDHCFIGPNCLVRAGAVIGAGSRLEAQVYVGGRCRIGARAQVLPGAVIGGRGFGWVPTPKGWVEKPQLGVVVVGDDVEIGANTCIDRGALDDTVIENGVKLDNQIQIAHNCRIGANTAIAACVGIAGSTVIGRNCMIGGAAGIGGHLQIADGVVILGLAMVTKSLTAPGVYGSGLPVMPAKDWRKLVARVRRLPHLDQRLALVERELKLQPTQGDASEPDDF